MVIDRPGRSGMRCIETGSGMVDGFLALTEELVDLCPDCVNCFDVIPAQGKDVRAVAEDESSKGHRPGNTRPISDPIAFDVTNQCMHYRVCRVQTIHESKNHWPR